MKKLLFRISSALLLCCLFFSFPSCQKRQEFSDDISASELMDTVIEQVPVNFGYETYGDDHLRYYFEDTKLHDDVCLRYSALSEDINEIGIFHTATRHDQEEIQDLAEDYLEDLLEEQSAFIASYAPEELPKLDNTKVKQFGHYVIYVISSSDRVDAAITTIEEKLK